MTTPALTSYLETLPDNGTFSVWAGPMQGPASVTHAADDQHYAASTMKVALVVAAYRRADEGSLDLDSRVQIHSEFDSVAPGARFAMDRSEDSDDETWQRMGTDVSLRWLANRAIVRSGNLATNLLLEAVGFAAVEGALRVIGASNTTVTRGIEDAPARGSGLANVVTAADLALTLRELHAHRVATSESCQEILATLAAQQINEAIPAGLPPGTKVAHKSGWVTGISHDAAIVYPDDSAPYVLVICTTSELAENDALALIARGAAASWQDRQGLA